MSELDDLIKQKKEIEKKIKQIIGEESVCGRAKIGVEHYSTNKPDRYYVALKIYTIDGNRERWFPVANATEKENAILRAKNLRDDLIRLIEKVEEKT